MKKIVKSIKKSKHITVIVPYDYIDSTPGLKSFIAMAAEAGYEVDVFALLSSRLGKPQFDNPRIRFMLGGRDRRISWLATIKCLWLFCCRAQRDYTCLIGAGLRGLIVATLASHWLRRPVVYFSVELYLSSDLRGIYQRAYKPLERWCHRRAAFTIVQGKERARLCANDNRVPLETFFSFANSPHGYANPEKTELLRAQFNIPANKKIILYAGGIGDTYMTREIVEAAQLWPEDWVLVIHSRARLTTPKQRAYLDSVQAADRSGRVIWSMKNLPYETLLQLVRSADVGLCLYKNVAINVSAMALSSGKLTSYLQCGVPVVASDFNAFRKVLVENDCGICVKNASEIAQAIHCILSDYKRFSTSAVACFDRVLSLNRYWPQIAARLAKFG